ncbi:hypothetical protein [Candidatus Thiosymbion oneisti]|uniref:hypothetical protein n=1 Tax=Candidatus Thiosymbion oneisti TaxID=589554 RepID=UPI002108C5D5|nr:hypothetical protein [Candidatus Thiosymbion oneisti]
MDRTKRLRQRKSILFLHQARGAAQRLRLSGDQDTYLDFRYLSCTLGELAYEHHRHSDNLVVRLNLPNMQYPAGRKAEVYAQAVRGLTTLERDPDYLTRYSDVSNRPASGPCWSGPSGSLPPVASTRFCIESGAKPK